MVLLERKKLFDIAEWIDEYFMFEHACHYACAGLLGLRGPWSQS
jgi:hypothetical protein